MVHIKLLLHIQLMSNKVGDYIGVSNLQPLCDHDDNTRFINCKYIKFRYKF